MLKLKINKQLIDMYDLKGISFNESQASRINDGKEETIKASRLYELVKEKKIKKTKLYFNSMGIINTFQEADIMNMIYHIVRIEKCDTNIPIIVGYKGEILDGLHRIMKAILEGKTRIRCYRIHVEDKEWEKQ